MNDAVETTEGQGKLRLFGCCRDMAADGAGFYAREGSACLIERHGPVIASGLPIPARDHRVAIHEAGHAVAAIAIGGACLSVTVDVPPHARTQGGSMRGSIAISIAGDAAANWMRRRIYRPSDEALLPILRMAAAGGGGSCDACAALRRLAPLAEADEQAVLALYREVEGQVIELVRAPAVWRSIRDLADALMAAGTLDDAEVLEITGRHFTPGQFNLNQEKNDARDL